MSVKMPKKYRYTSKRPEYYRLKIKELLDIAQEGLTDRSLRILCDELQQYCDDIYPEYPPLPKEDTDEPECSRPDEMG